MAVISTGYYEIVHLHLDFPLVESQKSEESVVFEQQVKKVGAQQFNSALFHVNLVL